MVYIPALNTVRVVLDQLFGVSELANIVYFLKAGGWNEGSMNDLAADMVTWWSENLAPILSDALALTGVTVTDLTTSSSPSISIPVVPVVPGQATTAEQATNVASVVTFRSANRGRSSRGRNYIPGITAGQMVSPTDVGTVFAGLLVDAYEALADVETENTCTHVVASFYTSGAPRVSALLQEVLNYTCDTALDSQRRRLRGRGE